MGVPIKVRLGGVPIEVVLSPWAPHLSAPVTGVCFRHQHWEEGYRLWEVRDALEIFNVPYTETYSHLWVTFEDTRTLLDRLHVG